jgi:L-malate glycosyltransferase
MLTVLLATHNGAGTLPRVLEAYERLTPPMGGWRVVLVDNASTDDTPAILKGFASRLPLLALRTERRGKNVALNLGLEHVDGDLVVLTDDDAVPEVEWLVALSQAAVRHQDRDLFGGQIDPIWPGEPPPWILRLVNLGATFAITGEDVAAGPMPAAQIWGPNMAVRTHLFRAGHRFDESIGPQAGQYVMGSEVEFTCRLERLGHSAWFVSDARVGHIIRPHQVERGWIIQRAYRLGRHMFHQERGSFAKASNLFRGAPRWKYRRLLAERWKALSSVISRDADQKFRADWEVSFLRGYLDEARRHADGSDH